MTVILWKMRMGKTNSILPFTDYININFTRFVLEFSIQKIGAPTNHRIGTSSARLKTEFALNLL